MHSWFKGLDWASLARTKAAFIPSVEHEYDTSYFMSKPVRLLVPFAVLCHACLFPLKSLRIPADSLGLWLHGSIITNTTIFWVRNMGLSPSSGGI